jgi:hypothetical protein
MGDRMERLTPLSGVVFVALVFASAALNASDQDPSKKTAAQIAGHYRDHASQVQAAGYLAGLAAVTLLFFAGWIRELLDRARHDLWASVAHGALIALAGAAAISGTLDVTVGLFADDLSPAALSAVHAIAYNFFMPLTLAMGAFLLAAGIGIVRGAALPRWTGRVACLLGLLCLVPMVGFFGFVAGMIWLLGVSIAGAARSARPEGLLMVDARRAQPHSPAT